MHKVRVGVLRGGSTGYETSLKTGEMVMKHLPDNYYTEDIFITKDGAWHKEGVEIKPHDALIHLDIIFNALHGPYATNSHLQHILDLHQIPYTGSGSFVSATTRNSFLTKQLLEKNKIRPIPYRLIEIPNDGPGEELTTLFKTYAPPLIIRPIGVHDGVMMAKTYPEFVTMLETAFIDADEVLLEEYIPGPTACVGVIDGYRDQDLYALPAMSSVELNQEDKKDLEALARQVHEALGMRHYSRVDFLISPTRGIFVTQVVPLPSFHEDSIFHRALTKVGAPVSHFLDHVVGLALNEK